MIKILNLVVMFFVEMAMLFSYGYFGFSQPWNFITKLLFTVGVLAVAITLWAIFAAPKSARRLKMPYLAIFRSGMFLIAAFLIFQTGHTNAAIAFSIVALVTQIVSYFTETEAT